jgi:hypothetical protein
VPDVVVELGGVVAAVLLELLAVVLVPLVAEPLEPQAATSSKQTTTPTSFAGR